MGGFFASVLKALADAFYAVFQAIGYDHPIHPLLVHITIGTVTAAFLFSYIGWIFKKPVLYTTARHAINLAAIAYLFTAALGLLDWQHSYSLAWGINIEMKIIFAALLGIALLITFLTNRRIDQESKIDQLFYLVCFVCVVGLGFFGGNIVYGTGIS